MKVRWSLQAEQDRLDIMTYIAEDSARAAIAMDELFAASCPAPGRAPMLGKPDLVHGTLVRREPLLGPSAAHASSRHKPSRRGGVAKPLEDHAAEGHARRLGQLGERLMNVGVAAKPLDRR